MISATEKKLREQKTKQACAGVWRRKELLLAWCRQEMLITRKGLGGGGGSRLGKILGWLEPLLLKCTNSGGLLRAEDSTAPLQQPSSCDWCEPEPENIRGKPWGQGSTSIWMVVCALREAPGPWQLRSTLCHAHLPRTPHQRSRSLLTAIPCRCLLLPGGALHDLLAVPPAASGNALQMLQGDSNNPEQ